MIFFLSLFPGREEGVMAPICSGKYQRYRESVVKLPTGQNTISDDVVFVSLQYDCHCCGQ